MPKQIPTIGELRAHLSKGDPNIEKAMEFYTGETQLPLRAIPYVYALLNARAEFVAVREYGAPERICSVSEAINIVLDSLTENRADQKDGE